MEKIEENFGDVGQNQEFLQFAIKNIIYKSKKDKLDLINIKNFCSTKDTVKRLKHTDTEKIFANYISNKSLVSRIRNEHSKFNS